jgi:hypothetical protein
LCDEFVVCRVGSGLCDELITRTEKSYRVCVAPVCGLEILTLRWRWPHWGCCVTHKKNKYTNKYEEAQEVILNLSHIKPPSV